ncbi:MAG: metabolite traffic protein EboE [Planctomycetes bacterium]|nr:metabolite traffic protein EboE [Planctomycetota bacterium]
MTGGAGTARSDSLGGRMQLTYCGNVHAAEDLDAWLDSTLRFAAPLAERARAAGRSFGLGAWWSAGVAARLASEPAARVRVAERLAAADLPLWTLNVFPHGGFHAAIVKTAVYRPAWSDPARTRYTLDAARAAAELALPGATVPLSTLPLGFGADVDRGACAVQLRTVARELHALRDATGRHLVLALEPEPDCLLERADATAAFLEDAVFRGQSDEAVLRAHLGVCVDLCHLAVVGEDPVAALATLRGQGVAVPKIQVSACPELRDPAGHLDDLLAFAEPRYLHQTVGLRDGAIACRALDLADVAARRREFAACERVRTHFHTPVFWDDDGPLGSTRAELQRTLASLSGPLPLLEVETYTWAVLDPAWRPDRDLIAGLAAELHFVHGLLDRHS